MDENAGLRALPPEESLPDESEFCPYLSSKDHIRDLLEPIRLRLLHRVSVDQLAGQHVAAVDHAVALAFLAENLESHRVSKDPQLAAALKHGRSTATRRAEATTIELRWHQLSYSFGLSELEQTLLLCAMAPDFSSGFARAFELVGSSRSGSVSVDLLATLVADNDEDRWLALEALGPSSLLLASGLLRFIQAGSSGWLPYTRCGVGVSPLLFEYLLDGPSPPARVPILNGVGRLIRPCMTVTRLSLEPEQLARFKALARALDKARRPLVIESAGYDPLGLAEACCDTIGTPMFILEHLANEPSPEAIDIYRQLRLLARLHHLTLVVDLSRRAWDPSNTPLIPLTQLLEELGLTRVLIATSESLPFERLPQKYRPSTFKLEPLNARQRAEIWQDATRNFGHIDEDVARDLALSLSLSEREIREAVERVGAEAELQPTRRLSRERLAAEGRQRLSRGIELVADKVETDKSLDDLILGDEPRERLLALLGHIQQLDVARKRFAPNLSRHGGTSVLLFGPPGTGKTLAATAIARLADRDLYRIAVSRVVDKYIGETEKQLERVFQLAEASGSIILFDEADSLFAARTSSVRSSVDRYANMQVNYLLQRMESYQGVCILTTNLLEAIDVAFRRRIAFQIEIPKPDIQGRQCLWRYFIPKMGLPELSESALLNLATRYEMSGGHIRNAVLKAAVRAVSNQEVSTLDLLVECGDQEYAALGGVVRHINTKGR